MILLFFLRCTRIIVGMFSNVRIIVLVLCKIPLFVVPNNSVFVPILLLCSFHITKFYVILRRGSADSAFLGKFPIFGQIPHFCARFHIFLCQNSTFLCVHIPLLVQIVIIFYSCSTANKKRRSPKFVQLRCRRIYTPILPYI